ncbi:MAG: arginine decarboxylase, pyruvoyl-dependent [Chloroflexi bacterium]|nr:arginine decarboxylase, pyruvoyl-dependent [Chloroflexota bacterium]
MLLIPDRLWITTGVADGETPLNAFDNALLEARIGNYNLVKVSSIVPAGAIVEVEAPEIVAGALVPAVLAVCTSEVPGQIITASVGLGLGKGSHGIIMEHTCNTSPQEAEYVVKAKVVEAFRRRGLVLDDLVVRTCHYKVERVGCAVAAVVLWKG